MMSPLVEFLVPFFRLLYLLSLLGLALYGALGMFTLFHFWRVRRRVSFDNPESTVALEGVKWPRVTVQLPLYNERYVVERLIHAAAALQYPQDRLDIQVIDDSTDDTTERAQRLTAYYAALGLDIRLLRRSSRAGYKAGALAFGLALAKGEFVAIFDADFQPEPDFLLRTIPAFLADRDLGVVQARWGHLNAGQSFLTAAQAIALDKHFAIEQTVRSRADLFPKFNGTAGVWRRACIMDAGGWQSDTLCEDLCLSTRAVLRGWRFEFLADVVAPAELPDSMSAYKNQQARWARGSTQCLLKFGAQIWNSPKALSARVYALLTMSAYATSLLLLLLLLLQVPLLVLQVDLPSSWAWFGLAGVAQPLLFVSSQGLLYKRGGVRRLWYLPALLLVAAGLSVTIGRAVITGLFATQHPFIRTPKSGARFPAGIRYRLGFDSGLFAEAALTGYAALGIVLALVRGDYGPLFLLVTCFLGFAYVSLLTLRDWLR